MGTFALALDAAQDRMDTVSVARDYCPGCGHGRITHSPSRGCYGYDCPCQLAAGDCTDTVGYRDSLPGDHSPVVCARLRDAHSANGYHAGWAICEGRVDAPSMRRPHRPCGPSCAPTVPGRPAVSPWRGMARYTEAHPFVDGGPVRHSSTGWYALCARCGATPEAIFPSAGRVPVHPSSIATER